MHMAMFPGSMETYADESVNYFVLYGTPFYLSSDTNDQEFVPQPWKYSLATQATIIRIGMPSFNQTNFECSQPPLYYRWQESAGGPPAG